MNRHPEQDPAEEPRPIVEGQLRADDHDEGQRDHRDERPAGSLPPFTDPAFSSKPASPAVRPDAPDYRPPPKDTEFAGHPEFSEEAARNEPPDGMGLTESLEEGEARTRKSEGVDMPLSDADHGDR